MPFDCAKFKEGLPVLLEKYIGDSLILFATIDPIGTLAIFVGLTSHMTTSERRRTALKATLYAGAVLVGAIIVGQILLSAMGIRLISLQVGGGIILLLFGLQMIFGTGVVSSPPKGESGHDIAVFPLAIPSIATPGAITAAILLTDNHVHTIPVQIGTTLIMVGILVLTCVGMMIAAPVFKVVGRHGAAILVRVMGMILSAFSVELIMEALGAERWLQAVP